MTGNNRTTMTVIQERDRRLMRELAVMRVMDREQARRVAGFGSASRTNRRLRKLTEAKLLHRYFLGAEGAGRKALYGLSRKGALLVDVPYRGLQRRHDEAIVTDLYVHHQLMVNEIYCSLKYGTIPIPDVAFASWTTFSQPLTPGLRLIPDGYVVFKTPRGHVPAFLEVDRGAETLATWKEKVGNYLSLAVSGVFERLFHEQRFRVFVIANSERRMLSIRKTVASITPKIFWFATFPATQAQGFFAPIWLRPVGDVPGPPIERLP